MTISLAKFERIAKEHSTSLIVWHFIIGLLGFLGILFMQWRLFRKEDEKIAAQFKAGLYRERSILLQSMGEGVYAMNLQGKCTVINPAALKMLGYTEDEVIGKSAHTLFHHHYCDNTVYPAELCNIHRVLDHRERVEIDTCFFRKNGEMFHVFCTATPVGFMTDTSDIAIVVGFVDVTEHKQAEQKRAALLRRNQVLMDNALEGIHILDAKGNLIDANNSFCRMLGYSREEMLRLNVTDWDAYKTPDEIRGNITQLLSGQAVFESVHRRRDGSFFDVELSIIGVELEGVKYLYCSCRDITERKKTEDEIRRLAFYDPLTGLANRRLLTDRMEQALAKAYRNGKLLAICMIDLDGFKQVNDQLGHKAGDQLLSEVARRITECIRESDTAARFGGDEFSLLLMDFSKISECELLLNRIINAISIPYKVTNGTAQVTASIGATIFPNDGSTADQLLRHADQAMYEAKQSGKNCYRFFNPGYQSQQLANQAMIKKISTALNTGQLILYYQPQVDCRRGVVVGMEALIRWNHPVLGLLMPAEFIPLLEKDDLLVTIGEWAIQQALQHLTAWQAMGFYFNLSVNICARQLHRSDFTARLKELLSGFDKNVIGHLCIEILETAALENIRVVALAVKECRALGLHIALDDFGTGYSSLTHLKNLNVDILKIDYSFISGMLNNADDQAIVNGVIALANSFGRRVIAEGVESLDQVRQLMTSGCDYIQGYYIARPMAADELPVWLANFQPDPLWLDNNEKGAIYDR